MGKETTRKQDNDGQRTVRRMNRCSLKRPARTRITVCVALCHTLVLSGGSDGRPRNVKRIWYPQSQIDTDWRIRHEKWVEWVRQSNRSCAWILQCFAKPCFINISFPACRTVAAEGNRAEGEITSPHSAKVCANSCISSAGPTRPTWSNDFDGPIHCSVTEK